MSDTPDRHPRTVFGVVALRRLGMWRFPVEELIVDSGPVALLGRDGSLRVLFGRGRRVQLTDGTEWRIRSIALGPYITPAIMSPTGKIAGSGPLPAKRCYGINLENDSYTLIPMERIRLRRPQQWVLRRHESEVGEIDAGSKEAHLIEPLPTAAILMAFTLITHGIPGENSLMPKRD